MTVWEKIARRDFTEEQLAQFFERAGKYEYDAGMTTEDADRRAYKETK